jgi:UDP-N-acetylmuramoylalanine--D-glutamate ligase
LRKDFNEFKEYIRNKNVAVVGIGVSNTPLIKMLVKLGAKVTACDKRENIGELQSEFNDLGVKLVLGEKYLEAILETEVVFRTPSLLPNNEYLMRAKQKGINVTSEMSEFIKYCPCKIFGVTGSDGKTTTTTLIGEMLKKQGHRVFVGGNIGTPLFTELENIKEDDFVVIELSSFQLMDIEDAPDIAVITNLSPNHLDYHKDMEEYTNAKKNIFKNQNKDNILVLNEDNEITAAMKNEAPSKVRFFSRKQRNTFSYLKDDVLVTNGFEICNIKDIIIPGMHNVENLLAAISAVQDFVSVENISYVATHFKGVEHRIEFVRELKGVKFYNGSIASSPTRTLADLNAFNKKVILIAGGYYKNIPFDALAEGGIDRIKLLVLMGDTKAKIREAFEIVKKDRGIDLEIIEAGSLEDAVLKAYEGACEGDIITLSPACASFDMFKNFEERGNAFKEIVNNI